MVSPHCIPLIAFPKAWSPGTDGPLVADVVLFDAKNEADLAKYKGKLKGAIVLTGRHREVSAGFEPMATRKAIRTCSSWPTPPSRTAVAAARRRPRPKKRSKTADRRETVARRSGTGSRRSRPGQRGGTGSDPRGGRNSEEDEVPGRGGRRAAGGSQ